MISLFISALCEGRRPTIYGDGEQTRDFTYVANVVDGVLRACTAPDASGEVINVATGGRISLNQLFADVAGDLVGRERRADLRRAARRRRARLAGRHQQGARLLGYEPIVAFEQGLEQTVAWFRKTQMTAS